MMKKICNSKLYLLISLVHTILTFFTDKSFFKYEMGLKVIIYKTSLFIILCIFYKFIFHVIGKLLDKDKRIIRNLKVFLIYFGIMLLFVIVCYPGNIKNDEIFIISSIKTLGCDSWYHVLTYYLCSLSMMIIPRVGGISLIQSFFCSLIFVYIYDKVMKNKKNTKLSYILMIPFLLLPVISSNLYPYRPSMYAYFEAFLIFYLYFKYKSEDEINWKFFVITGFFGAILANFRSEGIYYLICLPIGILLFFMKNNKKYILGFLSMIVVLISTYGFLFIQNKINTFKNDNIYSTLTYVIPLSMMLNEDLKGKNLEENLANLDKIFDMDKMKECASYKDVEPVWNCNALHGSDNDEDYNTALKSFFNLVKDNPQLFLKSKIKTFLATSALDRNASNMIYDSSVLFDSNTKYSNYPVFINSNPKELAIFPNVRRKVIRIIEGRNVNDYFNYEWTYPIFYNLIIPFGFLIGYLIYNLIKKRWFYFMLFMLIFIKIVLIFLTSPACYFMYYFSSYFVCVILMFVLLFEWVYKMKNKGKVFSR